MQAGVGVRVLEGIEPAPAAAGWRAPGSRISTRSCLGPCWFRRFVVNVASFALEPSQGTDLSLPPRITPHRNR